MNNPIRSCHTSANVLYTLFDWMLLREISLIKGFPHHVTIICRYMYNHCSTTLRIVFINFDTMAFVAAAAAFDT